MQRYRRKTVTANDPPGTRVVHNFPPGRPDRAYAENGWRYWITDEPNENERNASWELLATA